MNSIAKQQETTTKTTQIYKKMKNFPWRTWLPFIIVGVIIVICTGIIVWYAFDLFPNTKEKRVAFITANILSLLALAVIIVQALIYFRQWKTMEAQESRMAEQLSKMEIGLNQTQSLVRNADKQVIAMQMQTNAMHGQLGAMNEGLEQTKKIVDAMERQLDVAEKGRKQSERSMIYSQTAYVTVKDIGFSDYKIGDLVRARIVCANTGTTPAYEVRVYAHLDYHKIPFSFTHEEAKDLSEMIDPGKREAYPILVGPNGDDTTQDVFSPWLTTEMLEREKKEPLHFWGLITYVDIFGRDRWTEFCYRKILDGETTRKMQTLGLNETNNNADKPYIE